jgi:hypothetical protein
VQWTRVVAAYYATMLTLAACSMPLGQSRVPSGSGNVYAPPAEPADRGKFRGRLLFISDTSLPQNLYIYTLPGLMRIKTIRTEAPPSGVCADNNGDVWVAINSSGIIVEYSHTGVEEKSVTLPSGQYPQSCAVAPNDDLAVTTNSDGVGYAKVTIYPGGSGTPFSINDPNSNTEEYLYAGYDASGNLYFDAHQNLYLGVSRHSSRSPFALYKCSAPCTASSTVESIILTGETIYTPGMVESDDRRNDLVIGDQTCHKEARSCVYRVNTQTFKIEGVTHLMGVGGKPICDLIEGTINNIDGRIFGADNQSGIGCPHYSNTVYRWAYPAGNSLNSNSAYLEGPVGAAISIPRP